MKNNKMILTMLMTTLIFTVQAKKSRELSIQQRLVKLEQLVAKQPKGADNTADLVVHNQKLQQQIAKLKGVIEEQNHRIDSLKEKQKLLYLDIDSRLSELESGKNTGTSNTTNLKQPMLNTTTDAPVVDIPTTQIVTNNTPQLSSYQDEYDIAFAHLRAGRFLESARAFENFIQKYPDSELVDNAYYWLGESYYVKRQYPQALAAFQSLTRKFPNSNKAPDSWLKIGYSYYEMDDLVKAEENLKKVINNYPNSSVARLANNRLRQIQRDH